LGHVICNRELEDLAPSGRTPGKHTRGAQCFKNFKCMYKSLGNYGGLPRTQQKDHETSRAASAMIHKDKEADILLSTSRLGAVFLTL